MKYLLALDQGTTSSRAILFSLEGRPVAMAQREFRQLYPRPGWVEHDPLEIWESQLGVAQEALRQAGVEAREVVALGITNQRETTLVFEKGTGKPLHNAIVWQDRRTASLCQELKAQGLEPFSGSAPGFFWILTSPAPSWPGCWRTCPALGSGRGGGGSFRHRGHLASLPPHGGQGARHGSLQRQPHPSF
ncbi:hypothetical protein AN926_05950 [Thermus scotoductus]|uniref:Carbohydrate kinase FGGY N-terminal domain-containing protein n=1 Tax=Thermus scotoductus TaxID=37636 RepID=A0A0N0IQX3_THESC|nr:hypothetical protein AN926_05950 [Thermus scotoductus]